MPEHSLEDLLNSTISLKAVSPSGWHTLKCPVCNDYKYRGGFKFENDWVSYNCFNCQHKASYLEGSGEFSDDMVTLLRALSVDDMQINKLRLIGLKNGKPVKLEPVKINLLYPQEIEMPEHFYEVGSSDNIMNELALEYLKNRCITMENKKFFLSNDKKWKGRLIIPFYYKNKLVYYQGRDLLGKSKNRYKNPDTAIPRDNIVYNFDQLNNEKIYIVEGAFDAMSIDGTAILGNVFSKQQILILNEAKGIKIYIPDKTGGDISTAVNQAFDNGWLVSFPDVGGCKDTNAAVCKYGKLYVKKTIDDNVCSNKTLGNVKLKIYARK